MKLVTFKGGYDRNFCYFLIEKDEAICIDVFLNPEIEGFISTIKVKHIINTHEHHDHVSGNDYLISKGGEVVDEDFNFHGVQVKMIRTPGHSPLGKCIIIDKMIFTGDLLFVGKIGGTGPGFSGSDPAQQFESLQKIMELDQDLVIYPGHDYGKTPTSTIGQEHKTNPFILCKTVEELEHLKNNWHEYKIKNNLV